MKNLEELVQIVTPKKNRKNTIPSLLDTDTKLFHLFQSISVASDKPDENTFQKIHYDNDTGPFRVLKHRLREKLLQEAVKIDPAKIHRDQTDIVSHRCWRNLLLAHMLFLKFKRHAAMDILRQTIQQAKKFQLTGILVMAARTMRYHAAYSGSKTSFTHLDKLLKKSLKNLEAELRVEYLSQQMLLEWHHKISSSDSTVRKSKNVLKEVEKIAKQYPTFQNKLNLFRLGVRHFQMLKRHKTVIAWCEKANKYFESNPHLVQRGRLAEFALYKMYSNFVLSDFATGQKCAIECENLFVSGSDNWLIFREYYFLLCIHTGNYKKAKEAFYVVTKHQKFKTLPGIRIEKWKIFEAYLSFVLPDSSYKFNLFRFMNEVPMYSRDKSGFNLTIVIAHIILQINIGRDMEVMRMEEALNSYCNRNLRKRKNHRSYYFMKMILVLLKFNMNPEKSEEIAEKFLLRMKHAKEAEQQATEELEIIPYEQLWMLLLDKLKSRESIKK